MINEIIDPFNSNAPLDSLFHEKALNYYKEFLYVGGMPEVVKEFIDTKNVELVRVKQRNILEAYLNDMSKYNRQPEISKTQIVYKNISTQLAKENKKFKYANIKHGGRVKEFENAIEWICLSGIAHQLYRITTIQLPLNSYKSLSDFKFYMNDVGLVSASQDILYNDIVFENELLNDFKGGLTENYVSNQLLCNGCSSFYWTSDNEAEVDFILRINNQIIPIEVKSKDNTQSKSLNVYSKRYNPQYAIRISSKNFGFANNIKSVPLYAIFCII